MVVTSPIVLYSSRYSRDLGRRSSGASISYGTYSTLKLTWWNSAWPKCTSLSAFIALASSNARSQAPKVGDTDMNTSLPSLSSFFEYSKAFCLSPSGNCSNMRMISTVIPSFRYLGFGAAESTIHARMCMRTGLQNKKLSSSSIGHVDLERARELRRSPPICLLHYVLVLLVRFY